MMVMYEGKLGTQTHALVVKDTWSTITRLLAAHVAFLLHGVSWTVTLLQVELHTDRLSAELQKETETQKLETEGKYQDTKV